MSTITKDLGVVTAYGYYKAGGGTMTESEFTQFMVDFGTASKTATEAAQAALESENAARASEENATQKSTEASESASTASSKAREASQSASEADAAKDDAVSAKNAAEIAQRKAEDAQEATESVAESIPSDYSQLSEDVSELKSAIDAIDNNLGVYDIGTTYNTLDATYNRVMAIYPIKDVNATFCFNITEKTTNGTLSVRVCSDATPYSADILQSAWTIAADDTEESGEFTITESVKANAKYILILNATANLLVSFNVELWTKKSVEGDLQATKSTVDFINNATKQIYDRYEQGGINGTTGEKAASNATVRPDTQMDIDSVVSVELGSSSGLHVQLYSYSANGTYLGRNDLGANAFIYNSAQLAAYRSAKYVTFGIYRDGGGNLSPSDLLANGQFIITVTTISAILKMNTNTNTDFSELLKTVGKTPMVSWVDDDGVVTHSGGGGIASIVVPIADDVGIPVTFALIPPMTDEVIVGGVTMTKAQYFANLQKNGHQMVAHPVHTYWYGNDYDITEVNPSLIDVLTELQGCGFLHSDMLVYPGGSGVNPDVVEIVRKWCVCGVLSGYGTPNHLGDSTKWGIKRTFVNFEDYDSIHSSDAGYVSAMAWYKAQVDDAYENGDWIVFGTHSYQFSTSTDTTDPNANTLGNLKMLMQYAVTKGLEFRTLWDAYNRRKYLFEFNEMNR